jgi:hypothetical protein
MERFTGSFLVSPVKSHPFTNSTVIMSFSQHANCMFMMNLMAVLKFAVQWLNMWVCLENKSHLFVTGSYQCRGSWHPGVYVKGNDPFRECAQKRFNSKWMPLVLVLLLPSHWFYVQDSSTGNDLLKEKGENWLYCGLLAHLMLHCKILCAVWCPQAGQILTVQIYEATMRFFVNDIFLCLATNMEHPCDHHLQTFYFLLFR